MKTGYFEVAYKQIDTVQTPIPNPPPLPSRSAAIVQFNWCNEVPSVYFPWVNHMEM